MNEFQYPDLQVGDNVLFATEPSAPESHWRRGVVECCKNFSCDISIVTPSGPEPRSDCWHADDPRCMSQPQTYRQPGRGVFKLSPREIADRKFHNETLPALLTKIETLSRKVDAIDRQKAAELLGGNTDTRPRARA